MSTAMVDKGIEAQSVGSQVLAEALARCSGAYVAILNYDGSLKWDNRDDAAWFGLLLPDADATVVLERLINGQAAMRDAIVGSHRRTFGGVLFDTSLFIDVLPSEDGSLLVCHTNVFEGGVGKAAEIPLESDSDLANLTSNEREVLELIGSGMKTREIAKIIHRSEKTIEARRSALGKKLGVETRGELVRVAVRAGLSRL